MNCPRCSKNNQIVKNGKTHNDKQRYLCRRCSFNFSVFSRGKSDEIKIKALELYLEGHSFRSIGKTLDVSNVTVLRWIRKARKRFRQLLKDRIEMRKSQLARFKEMELKDMWQHISKRRSEYRRKFQLEDLI